MATVEFKGTVEFKVVKRTIRCSCGITWNEHNEEFRCFCQICKKSTESAEVLDTVMILVPIVDKKCARSCGPGDFYPGGKCDLNGCYE